MLTFHHRDFIIIIIQSFQFYICLIVRFFPANSVALLSELDAAHVAAQQLVLARHAAINARRLEAQPLYGFDLRRKLRFVKVCRGGLFPTKTIVIFFFPEVNFMCIEFRSTISDFRTPSRSFSRGMRVRKRCATLL